MTFLIKKKEIIQFPKKQFLCKYDLFSKYFIKKGKKHLIENEFRKLFLFWAKSKNIENKNFEKVLDTAFKNTTPKLSVKSKRKGSKNIFIPIKISENKGKFLSSTWLRTNALSKKKNNFYQGVLEEFIESSLKKSGSVKKYNELYSTIENNLFNLK